MPSLQPFIPQHQEGLNLHNYDKIEQPVKYRNRVVSVIILTWWCCGNSLDTALAFPRVLIGLISAGYNHGSGSHVAAKEAMYVNNPTAAPFAALFVPGIKAAKTRTMDNPCPRVPAMNSLRRPARSMMNHDVVAKAA